MSRRAVETEGSRASREDLRLSFSLAHTLRIADSRRLPITNEHHILSLVDVYTRRASVLWVGFRAVVISCLRVNFLEGGQHLPQGGVFQGRGRPEGLAPAPAMWRAGNRGGGAALETLIARSKVKVKVTDIQHGGQDGRRGIVMTEYEQLRHSGLSSPCVVYCQGPVMEKGGRTGKADKELSRGVGEMTDRVENKEEAGVLLVKLRKSIQKQVSFWLTSTVCQRQPTPNKQVESLPPSPCCFVTPILFLHTVRVLDIFVVFPPRIKPRSWTIQIVGAAPSGPYRNILLGSNTLRGAGLGLWNGVAVSTAGVRKGSGQRDSGSLKGGAATASCLLPFRMPPRWLSANSLDSHLGGNGSDLWFIHPDFGFPWFTEISPGECWDESLTKAMAYSFPFLPPIPLRCANCTISNDLAVDETHKGIGDRIGIRGSHHLVKPPGCHIGCDRLCTPDRARVAERLARFLPSKVKQVQSPAGSPDFRK
ncbi:hypothetical protein PR048_019296 [Dryococelus australis]|uniref:Uncharacterized protein n=1 Tax=Dryococelus australis TaxID=614101 RepID=A0ABQ9H346_9NEOP|nr:hypothetical protein PR048_019296 [Dryococelus australis]